MSAEAEPEDGHEPTIEEYLKACDVAKDDIAQVLTWCHASRSKTGVGDASAPAQPTAAAVIASYDDAFDFAQAVTEATGVLLYSMCRKLRDRWNKAAVAEIERKATFHHVKPSVMVLYTPELVTECADLLSDTIGKFDKGEWDRVKVGAAHAAVVNGQPEMLEWGLWDSPPLRIGTRVVKMINKAPVAGLGTAIVLGPSGCGKTRGCLEFLSAHWGLYFVGTRSGNTGSGDAEVLLRAIEGGREGTTALLKASLALIGARVLLLRYVLEFRPAGLTKTQWLYVQCHPPAFEDSSSQFDVFSAFARQLLSNNKAAGISAWRTFVTSAAKACLTSLCLRNPWARLTIVIDEAQALCKVPKPSLERVSVVVDPPVAAATAGAGATSDTAIGAVSSAAAVGTSARVARVTTSLTVFTSAAEMCMPSCTRIVTSGTGFSLGDDTICDDRRLGSSLGKDLSAYRPSVTEFPMLGLDGYLDDLPCESHDERKETADASAARFFKLVGVDWVAKNPKWRAYVCCKLAGRARPWMLLACHLHGQVPSTELAEARLLIESTQAVVEAIVFGRPRSIATISSSIMDSMGRFGRSSMDDASNAALVRAAVMQYLGRTKQALDELQGGDHYPLVSRGVCFVRAGGGVAIVEPMMVYALLMWATGRDAVAMRPKQTRTARKEGDALLRADTVARGSASYRIDSDPSMPGALFAQALPMQLVRVLHGQDTDVLPRCAEVFKGTIAIAGYAAGVFPLMASGATMPLEGWLADVGTDGMPPFYRPGTSVGLHPRPDLLCVLLITSGGKTRRVLCITALKVPGMARCSAKSLAGMAATDPVRIEATLIGRAMQLFSALRAAGSVRLAVSPLCAFRQLDPTALAFSHAAPRRASGRGRARVGDDYSVNVDPSADSRTDATWGDVVLRSAAVVSEWFRGTASEAEAGDDDSVAPTGGAGGSADRSSAERD